MTKSFRNAVRRWSALAVMTALGAAVLASPAQADNTNVDRLRVLSYNMCAQSDKKCEETYGLSNSHGTRMTSANSVVVNAASRSKRPDVILLQEVGPDIFDNARVEKVFPGYGVARQTEGRWILYNTATLVYGGTGGIVSTATRKFPWARFARVGKSTNKVNVVNVHLTGDDTVAKQEIASLASALSGDLGTRTVIGGDFNATPGTDVLTKLNSSFSPVTGTLTNAVTQQRRTSTYKETTALPFKPIAGNKAIDHLFAGTGLTRVSSEIYADAGETDPEITTVAERTAWWNAVSNRRSDHNAVYAELAW